MRIVSCTFTGLFFLFLSTSIFAADYIFIGNGAWSNPANWAGKIIPPRNLKAGNTITINGNAITTAECCENDFESNSGTVIVSLGGSLTLQNATQFENHGTILVLGTLINKTHFEVYNNSSITLAVLSTFTNQLWIGNQGLITVNGGTINNTARLDNDMDVKIGRIIVNCGGTFNNTSSGVLAIGNSTFNCGTVINNSGIISNTPISGKVSN